MNYSTKTHSRQPCFPSGSHRLSYAEKFDLWCEAYDPLEIELSFIRSIIADRRSRILDVGAGTGRLAIPLAKAGHTVHAVEADVRLASLIRRKARTMLPRANKLYVSAGDVFQIKRLPQVDIVLFSWAPSALVDVEKAAHLILQATRRSHHRTAIVIEPWGNSDYSKIVKDFLPRTAELGSRQRIKSALQQNLPTWALLDYGVHDIPYIFDSEGDVQLVFEYAIRDWHGADLKSNGRDSLRRKLGRYRKGGRYCVFEKPRFMCLHPCKQVLRLGE